MTPLTTASKMLALASVGDETFLQRGNVGIEGTETCDGLLDAERHGIAKRVAVQAGSVLAPEKIGLAAQSYVVADENFATSSIAMLLSLAARRPNAKAKSSCWGTGMKVRVRGGVGT